MKTDELEKFVIENRDGFDDFDPDPAIWAQVQKNVKPVRKISATRILLRVAAVIVIFISSYVFHDYQTESSRATFMMEQADANQIEAAKNFFEAKAYYTSMIGSKEREVFELSKNYPQIKKELISEFKEIDQEQNELQKDLKDGASNKEIIEAMIQNYRIQLDILESVLYELSTEINDEKYQENEI